MFAGKLFRRQPADPQQRAARRPLRRRFAFAAAGLMLLLGLLIVPAVSVGAQSAYPPNTVVSTYYDARYGEVSVVTDAYGNLIDVNAVTGQRIYPVYADYAPSTAYTNYPYANYPYVNYPYTNGYVPAWYVPQA
jgi:hypothetical protein